MAQPLGRQAGHEADVDEGLAPAIEDGVHEGAELADLARRPGQGAVEHVEDAAGEDDEAADQPELEAEQDGADGRDPEADEGEPVGGEAEAPEEEGDRLADLLDAAPRVVRDGHAQLIPRMARSRAATSPNASGRREQIVSRPARRRDDEAGLAQAAQVMADEWLAEADVVDEVADAGRARRRGAGRCAAGSRRRAPCGRCGSREGRPAGRRSRRSWSGSGRARGSGVRSDRDGVVTGAPRPATRARRAATLVYIKRR